MTSKKETDPQPKVFLSYASEDYERMLNLYADLMAVGVKTWIDRCQLGPGRWEESIKKAISQSRYFVVCFSNVSLTKLARKEGFQHRELMLALELEKSKDGNEFSIIPVRIEDCELKDPRLAPFQQYDLFPNWNVGLKRIAAHLTGKSDPTFNIKAKYAALEDFMTTILHEAKEASKKGDHYAAIDKLVAIRSIGSEAPEIMRPILVATGWKRALLGHHVEAISDYDRALDVSIVEDVVAENCKKPRIIELKALSLLSLGQHEDAAKTATKGLRSNDAYQMFMNDASSRLLSLSGPFAGGDSIFLPLMIRGVALFALGKDNQAQEDFQRAFQANPMTASPLMCLSTVLAFQGQLEKAERAFNLANRMTKKETQETDMVLRVFMKVMNERKATRVHGS
ncbi:MAG: TIR domain-containing protein [Desulfobacter sp.]|nr:MAG: TIR domain-containing protein [Desulfobacter sp.]